MTAKCILEGRLEYLTEQLINLQSAQEVMRVLFQDAELFLDGYQELTTAIMKTKQELGGLK